VSFIGISGANAKLVSISTVVTPAKTYDLTTLAVVKGLLNITNSAQDAYLQSLISAASAAAAQYCNRVFPAEEVLDEVWPALDAYPYQVPGGIAPLQLSRWPLGTITSVVISTDPTSTPTTLTSGTDFRFDTVRGQLIRLDFSGYPCGWAPSYIAADYIGGFATIPADVADAVCRMVRSRYYANTRDPMLRSENIEGVYEASYWISAVGNNGNLTPDVLDILDNYRTPVIA
jgi:Phage gp6-like head-tail connector protein